MEDPLRSLKQFDRSLDFSLLHSTYTRNRPVRIFFIKER
jgi:hypothetical protein